MPWTTPRTWTDGENVTAPQFNSNIRDDLNCMWHLIARKTSDTPVTSSTTMVDATGLAAPVAANEVWFLRFTVLFTGGAGDMDLQFTFPSGGTMSFTTEWQTAAAVMITHQFAGTSSPTSRRNFNAFSTTVPSSMLIEGLYMNGGTAGAVQLQFAQNVSSGTATTIKTNAVLIGAKIA